MPRPRYPSDDARIKTKPGVRIHHSIRNHPRYGPVLEPPEMRGMWLGLLLIASERHAGKTADWVTLNSGDVVWLTGRRHYASAERALSRLCAGFGYAMSKAGHGYRVQVRNFARKQGHPPRVAEVTPRTPDPSEYESESESNIPSGDGGVGGVQERQESEKDANYRWPQEIPALAKEEFLKLVRFAKKRGFRGDIRPALEQAIRRVGLNSHSRSWQELMGGMTFEALQAELEVRIPNGSRLERGLRA